MLMQESPAAETESDGDVKPLPATTTTNSSVATMRKFITAAFNTKPLAKPSYIVMAGHKLP